MARADEVARRVEAWIRRLLAERIEELAGHEGERVAAIGAERVAHQPRHQIA
jgi:hypothetical protein